MNISRADGIHVNVFGGLGNQFFCYFAGKYLSDKLNLKLTVDITRVNQAQFNSGSSLDDFELSDSVVNSTCFPHLGLHQRVARKIAINSNKILNFPLTVNGEYIPHGLGFEVNLNRIRKPVVLSSYFQSYKYFDSLSPLDQSIPGLKGNGSLSYKLHLQKVKEEQPVVIHFRRGDYLKHKSSFGNLDRPYYENAYQQLPVKFQSKICWVFSDDLDTAKAVLREVLPSSTYWVDPNSELSAAQTLHLMTFGSGYIIANSTFSYWGAKFNPSEPHVIAPTKWFRNLTDPIDLIPPYWHTSASYWD